MQCARSVPYSPLLGNLPANAIYTRNYSPPRMTLASIKLNYSRLVADAGPCGQWPRDVSLALWKSGKRKSAVFSMFGCASQRNLAAIVDRSRRSFAATPANFRTHSRATQSSLGKPGFKGDNPSGQYVGYDRTF